jgi:predicted phosphodiesterase
MMRVLVVSDQYLPASDVDGWRSAVAGIDADLVLVGHTHLPVILELGAREMVNPGSAGLPRDGDARVCYAVIEDGHPVLKRVAYDVEKTVADLWSWGLPDDVARSLEATYRGETVAPPVRGVQT